MGVFFLIDVFPLGVISFDSLILRNFKVNGNGHTVSYMLSCLLRIAIYANIYFCRAANPITTPFTAPFKTLNQVGIKAALKACTNIFW